MSFVTSGTPYEQLAQQWAHSRAEDRVKRDCVLKAAQGVVDEICKFLEVPSDRFTWRPSAATQREATVAGVDSTQARCYDEAGSVHLHFALAFPTDGVGNGIEWIDCHLCVAFGTGDYLVTVADGDKGAHISGSKESWVKITPHFVNALTPFVSRPVPGLIPLENGARATKFHM